MTLENVWNFIKDNFLIWIIIGYGGHRIIKAIGSQKLGEAIMAFLIASGAWYFVANPEQVMTALANIWSKLFNR